MKNIQLAFKAITIRAEVLVHLEQISLIQSGYKYTEIYNTAESQVSYRYDRQMFQPLNAA